MIASWYNLLAKARDGGEEWVSASIGSFREKLKLKHYE